MKKGILVLSVIAIFSITAFGYMNWNNDKCTTTSCQEEVASCTSSEEIIPRWQNIGIYNLNDYNQYNKIDFIYNINSRFIWNITKEELNQAKSIIDIYPKDATLGMDNFSNVQVTLMNNGKEVSEFGEDETLNEAQLKLLQTLDYSSNFYVRANYTKTNYAGQEVENYIVYYITVVPEKKAVYNKGKTALIDYLKKNTAKDIEIVKKDKLEPGQIRFTVTTDGTIADVNLDSSSGYKKLDKKMVKLIENMPEKWEPATNAKGEPVEQTLIFFYGIEGC